MSGGDERALDIGDILYRTHCTGHMGSAFRFWPGHPQQNGRRERMHSHSRGKQHARRAATAGSLRCLRSRVQCRTAVQGARHEVPCRVLHPSQQCFRNDHRCSDQSQGYLILNVAEGALARYRHISAAGRKGLIKDKSPGSQRLTKRGAP